MNGWTLVIAIGLAALFLYGPKLIGGFICWLVDRAFSEWP